MEGAAQTVYPDRAAAELEDIIKRFPESDRSGFYLSVAQEGAVSAGDPVTLVSRDDDAMTVAGVVDAHRQK